MDEDFIPISPEECITKYGRNETTENGKFIFDLNLKVKYINRKVCISQFLNYDYYLQYNLK